MFSNLILITSIELDRPSPPENVSVSHVGSGGVFNISWTAIPTIGVNQTYTVSFQSHKNSTTSLYFIHQQSNTNVECGKFLAFVKAVNEAGESDPSNNVSIPSLPDIGPVTASLTHQVWKYDGQVRVNVSFQVRYILWYHDALYIVI